MWRETPKEYIFKETENPTISLTLCGVPKPSVTWQFNRGLIREVNLVRNSYYAYRYNITLPKLRRPVCKGYISIKADGFLNYGHKMNIKVPVFSECKWLKFNYLWQIVRRKIMHDFARVTVIIPTESKNIRK